LNSGGCVFNQWIQRTSRTAELFRYTVDVQICIELSLAGSKFSYQSLFLLMSFVSGVLIAGVLLLPIMGLKSSCFILATIYAGSFS